MTSSGRILVVEDGAGEREALVRVLRMSQYDVLAAENPEQALRYIDEPIDLVLSDLRMGKSSGLDLLRYWQGQRPSVPFIMITAYGEVETAVTAMKLGAKDYLIKPVDLESLLQQVRRCLARRPQPSSPAAATRPGLPRVVGASAAMRRVCEQTRRVAESESTVLILGESGTGKELIAEAIHQNSFRIQGPLVVVNMAAIPETLVESELFGHVKGAFTGASADRAGRFEQAQGGTIFIDEIGDFPTSSQAKLLRVLENRTISRVGSNNEVAIDVRVVAATSRNLPQLVEHGAFREDLYYRLNVVVIQLPPLRERREDIPVLAEHFLRELCQANHLPPLTMDLELVQYLEGRSWPGNVRQLRNCLESMVVMTRGTSLGLADLPPSMVEPGASLTANPGSAAKSKLNDVERAMILKALEQCQGNRTRAAEALGISVRTLQRRLREWGVYD